MISKQFICVAFIALCVGSLASTLSAQKVEGFVYGGGIFPSATSIGQFVNTNIWGAGGGVFLTSSVELEGKFGFINHFNTQTDPNPLNAQLGLSRPAGRGYVYDLLGSYNLGQRPVLGARIEPYVTLGVGVLHSTVDDSRSVLIHATEYNVNPLTGLVVPSPVGSTVLDNGDNFFNFTYGGGIKAISMWGPMGLRADIRARTIPNFFGKTVNWLPELTGGVIFTFGER